MGPRSLTRIGDRLLLTAHGSDGYTHAIALDSQAQTVGAKACIAGVPASAATA
ncbi:MAG TPA: hypothetical protein VEO54_10975 [Thermoanaerobaculia bacterium]|nr:hypothetical protein [Thermoanaerobaculia bacterium]